VKACLQQVGFDKVIAMAKELGDQTRELGRFLPDGAGRLTKQIVALGTMGTAAYAAVIQTRGRLFVATHPARGDQRPRRGRNLLGWQARSRAGGAGGWSEPA